MSLVMKVRDVSLNMMNSALNMMNYVVNMMNYVVKIMSSCIYNGESFIQMMNLP